MKTPQLPCFSITKKDFIRQTFRCGGNGGQNVNKVETGVRFIHEPSGARGESCTYRTQYRNECAAFERLANSKEMQHWIRIEIARRMGHESPEEIRARVDREVDAGFRNGSIVVEEL